MIWVGGEVVNDDELKISALDRTFKHGLGLFETLRTWNGHATLLGRHTARITQSAEALGIPLDPKSLPKPRDVAKLLEADRRPGDAQLRIALSGGTNAPGSAVLWMTSAPLPPDWGVLGSGNPGRIVELAHPALAPDWGSRLGRHKTMNYLRRQEEFEARGSMESLVQAEDGMIVEGTRTNVFFVRNGVLKTAGLSYPILPGVMRSVVLERAAHMGIGIDEFTFQGTQDPEVSPGWAGADEVFLTNSLRGIVPVARMAVVGVLNAPGPITTILMRDVLAWLERGGIDP